MSYEWVKALHVISMVAWMAGMFYLPRLYVYHADAAPGSDLSETLKVMERRLLRAIINPAMISTFVFGIWMLVLIPEFLTEGWFHVKLTCLVVMTGFHGFMARWRRDFAADANKRPARFYRIANEVPTILLIVIVIMVIVKPFS
ncbi:protoporphyrinogen oxidase HemJ [Nisaea acidiphila]|uniref:Protoporphyrinogen IX oxidase n=1 Tax=Nisaea acidiphila TaxID=1862145 RepID=A0A9J7ALA1_9PROT|nr:protoporphyrinogen oxidase HemJ [Nisaea acidiphila]UUX47934.1 protoporphyrinogen oxidase HemJ [Nisaea acidiphila]